MSEPAAGHLSLAIVTPAGQVTKTQVTELQAPGVAGEFGVLPGHIPFLSAIHSGVLTYAENGKPHVVAVGPGYVEVGASETVVVLTESLAEPDDIDLAAATLEEEAATEALAHLSAADQPAEHAQQSAIQAWARARREAVERHRLSSAH